MSASAVGTRRQISREELFTKKAYTLDGLRALLNDGLDPNATIIAEDIPPTMRIQYTNESAHNFYNLHFYKNSRTLLAWVIEFSHELASSLELLIKRGTNNPFRRFAESISFRLTMGDKDYPIPRNDTKVSKAFKDLKNLKCDIKQEGFFPILFLLLEIRERGYERWHYELCDILEFLIDAGADIPIEFFRQMESEFEEKISKNESIYLQLRTELTHKFRQISKVINEKIQERNKESSAAIGAGDAKSQAEPSGEADTKQAKDRDDGALERERKELAEAIAFLETQKSDYEIARNVDYSEGSDEGKKRHERRSALRPKGPTS